MQVSKQAIQCDWISEQLQQTQNTMIRIWLQGSREEPGSRVPGFLCFYQQIAMRAWLQGSEQKVSRVAPSGCREFRGCKPKVAIEPHGSTARLLQGEMTCCRTSSAPPWHQCKRHFRKTLEAYFCGYNHEQDYKCKLS